MANNRKEPAANFEISVGEVCTLFTEGQRAELLMHDSLGVQVYEDKKVLIHKLQQSIFDDIAKGYYDH